MSSQEDPQKLLQELGSSGMDRELRLGLGRLAGRLPSEARLARMAAAVGLDASAPEPAPKTEPSAAASIKPPAIAVGGIVAAGGIVLAVWALRTPPGSIERRSKTIDESGAMASATVARTSSGSEPRASAARRPEAVSAPGPSQAPAMSASAEAPAASSEPVQPVPITPVLPSARSAEASASAPLPARPTSKSAASSAAAPGSKPPPAIGITETQILRDARLVLDRDPRSALALSEQHRRDYPNGSFVQERELIAITALVKLGRAGEAADRAARFRSVYPSSPYRARLDRIVP